VVVFTPSSRPTSSTATTVWVRLCASIPRVTMIQSPFTSSGRDGTGRWAHLSGGDATLLSSHAGRFPASGGRQKACCPQEAPTLRAKPPDNDHRDTEPDATGRAREPTGDRRPAAPSEPGLPDHHVEHGQQQHGHDGVAAVDLGLVALAAPTEYERVEHAVH